MKTDGHARQVLLMKLFAAASTYLFIIILARVMRPEDFGQVAFFLNATLLISVAGACGQQMAVLRFVPQFRAQDRQSALPPRIRVAFAKAIFGGIVGALICLAIYWIARWFGFDGFEPVVVLLGICLIPVVGWIDMQSHLARALGHYQASLLPKEILWRVGSGALVIGVFIENSNSSVATETVLFTLLLVLIILAVGQQRYLGKQAAFIDIWRQVPSAQTDRDKDWSHASGSFWVSSVSNIFLANADVIIVGLFVGTREAGIYFAANRLAQVLAFFTASYNIVIGPVLASAWHSGHLDHAAITLRNAAVKSTLPTVVTGLILWIFSSKFLSLFGPEYSAAMPYLKILIIAGVLNAASGASDIALNMCGFDRPAMKVSAASVVVSGITLIVGAIFWDAFGVAIAVLISTIFRKSAFCWMAFRYMSVRSDVFGPTGPKNERRYSAQT